MSENGHARDIVALQKKAARDEGTTNEVIVSSRGGYWHEPADDATHAEPKPACRSDGSRCSHWSWMDRDQAQTWRERQCKYCADEFEAQTGTAILPQSREVEGDD